MKPRTIFYILLFVLVMGLLNAEAQIIPLTQSLLYKNDTVWVYSPRTDKYSSHNIKKLIAESDSLQNVIMVHEVAEKVLSGMLYKTAVRNDSLVTAYNKLLTEYQQFAIKVKKYITK